MDSKIQNIAILINTAANGGKAKSNWNKIKADVIALFPNNAIIKEYEPPFNAKKYLQILIEEYKVNCFISAGGDGSLNWILNVLIDIQGKALENYYLGAIGLGSSNDFHKPAIKFIHGIPIRINLNSYTHADIGKVSYNDQSELIVSKHFLINSSIGVTAQANLFFNHGDFLLRFLKPRFTNLAILYTSIRAILLFKNINARVVFNTTNTRMLLSNLAILKNPNVSGKFRYDQQLQSDDGNFGINISVGMNKLELLATLLDLSKGQFSGKKKRITASTKSVRIATQKHIALEMDGEVFLANNMHFSMLPNKINLLNN